MNVRIWMDVVGERERHMPEASKPYERVGWKTENDQLTVY